jgi:glutaredoxin
MAALDRIRDRAWKLLDRPGRLASVGKRVNDALGRPLAPEAELADRRAFEDGYHQIAEADAPAQQPVITGKPDVGPAPVVIFTLDKQRRDAERLAQILDDAGVAYEVRSLENYPAAQAAVRRDSKGFRLPVVFIAGDAIGGRTELTNLGREGIRRLVTPSASS